MDLNKKDMKNIMLLILFGVLVYVGIQRIDMIWFFLSAFLNVVYPFLLGAAMAFVLNVVSL